MCPTAHISPSVGGSAAQRSEHRIRERWPGLQRPGSELAVGQADDGHVGDRGGVAREALQGHARGRVVDRDRRRRTGDRDDGTPKDTARNIRQMHEFVVNLVDESVAEAMNRTAASLPYGVSELAGLGLTTQASTVVRPPRIAESPASLECTEWGTLQIGDNRLIIGLIKRIHVRDEFFDANTQRIRTERLTTIGRMASPHWYCRTGDRFEMQRPD